MVKKREHNLYEMAIHFCTSLVQKYLPDPYIFAVLLTFIVFVLSIIFTKQTLIEVTSNWGNGVWSLLAFSMQMLLVVMSGYTLASSKPFKKMLNTLTTFLYFHFYLQG